MQSESRAQWERVVDEAREARVAWDDVCLCFSRSSKRPAPTESGLVTVTVGIIPLWNGFSRPGKTLLVYASVDDATDRLPPRIVRKFRHVLHEAGFEPDGMRSGRRRERLRGRVGFNKKLTTESAAVRTCLRIHEALLDASIA